MTATTCNDAPAEAKNHEAIKCALNAALKEQGNNHTVVEIQNRQPSIYTSTFPLEVFTCRFSNGEERKVLCKRQPKDLSISTHRQWGGVGYEAAVYREILQHARVTTPRFIGAHADVKNSEFWLFLEYLEDNARLYQVDIQTGLLAAARWLGTFHADNEKGLGTNEYSFLIRFDDAYYTGWIARTLDHTQRWHQQYPWLPSVCNEFLESLDLLLDEPLTIIHSEFYPKNILVSKGNIYPVDWESAAVAAGEIDLACLTEGWGSAVGLECESAYSRARWLLQPPETFSMRMKTARMYQEFRWLGDEYQKHEWGSWRIERIGRLAKELGFFT